MAASARTTEAETVEAVERFNEAVNRHDIGAVVAAMTEDCVFETSSPPAADVTSRSRRSFRPETVPPSGGRTGGTTLTATTGTSEVVDVFRVRGG